MQFLFALSVALLFAHYLLAVKSRVLAAARVRTHLSIVLLIGTVFLTAMPTHALVFAVNQQFTTGSNPTSVAIGDFNHDGKLDLVVANSASNTVSVLLGKGDGTFREKIDYITGDCPSSITVGYFNGDGNLDIAVTNWGDNTVSILRGNGDGTFQDKTDNPTGEGPSSITVGYFNNDDKLDLAVTNSTSNNISVLLGNGDGTFQLKTDYPSGQGPSSITVGDFNNDDKLDLAVTNSSSNNVSVLLGNGDGTFNDKIDYPTGETPSSITVGDFNNDGNPDLVITNTKSKSISVLTGNINGDGGFLPKQDYTTGDSPSSITVSDFNNDGNLDLVVTNSVSNNVSVLLGIGNGTFLNKFDYITGDGPSSVMFGDCNGDGTLDLVVANKSSDNISVLLGNGNRDGSFPVRVDYQTESFPDSVTAKDFNGDGKLDLVVANSGSDNISVFLGNGVGTFESKVNYSTGGSPSSVVVGKFIKNGTFDLAVANYNDGTVSILLGNGDGTFQSRTDYPTGGNPNSVIVDDFNGDGNLDLIVANSGSSSVSVLLGNGDGTFQSNVDYSTGYDSCPFSVTVSDVNGDGKLDLIVANYGSVLPNGTVSIAGTVSILYGNGNGTFQSKIDITDFPHDSLLSSVTAGDFNGDNKLDLAVTNWYGNTVSIFLGNGDGTFQGRTDHPTGKGPSSVTAGVFNGDGKLDLIVTNSGSDTVSVLQGNGDGTFRDKIDFATGASPSSVTVGNFNGDGKLDAAVTNASSGTLSVLLNVTPPVLTVVTPASLDFGSLSNGSTSTTQSVTIKNDGFSTLTVSGITLAGTDPTQFSVVPGTCPSLTPTIAAGNSCTISVSFAPTSTGTKNATLRVSSNDLSHPSLDIPLTGTGTPHFYTLTVEFAGAGSGSITGTAPGYSNTSCDKGIPGSCTPATYQEETVPTVVTLLANADWKSTFSTWGGVDTSLAGTATVIMNTNRIVTATFDPVYKVKLLPAGTLYASIQDAYKDATSGCTILAQTYPFLESATFANSTITSITLNGGMDTNYLPTSGYSTIRKLTVSSGKVIVRNIKITQ